MKRRKLERLIVEIIEDREAVIADEKNHSDAPWAFVPFDNGVLTTITRPLTVDATVRCTCPPNRGDNYAGSCRIHDVQATMTTARWQA